MRHENIEITLKYYVEQDADAAGDIIWQSVALLVALQNQKSLPNREAPSRKQKRSRATGTRTPDLSIMSAAL